MTNSAPVPPIAFRHELGRKAIHLASAAFPLAYAWWLSREQMLVVLTAASTFAIVVEIGRRGRTRAAALFERTIGPMLRAHERTRAVGATWMLLSFLILVAVGPKAVAIAAMCAVSFGDAVAALVGRSVGRVRLGVSGKTLEGAAACLLASWAAAHWIALLSPPVATIAALAATAAEIPDGPGDDNARVAFLTAAAAYVGTLLFGVAGSTVS